MLTIQEFKKNNKLSNEQLAALIGVSKETVSAMLKGREITRNRDRLIPRLKELGIVPPGDKPEPKPRDPNELITINEYFEESGMTVKGFADLLEVSSGSLYGWLQGRRASEEMCERLKRFGIKHPSYKEKPLNESNIGKKTDNKKGFLKDFQIAAVKKFGNTIVSKRHSEKAIIDEFAKFGLKVQCREFETYRGGHYVVEIDYKG